MKRQSVLSMICIFFVSMITAPVFCSNDRAKPCEELTYKMAKLTAQCTVLGFVSLLAGTALQRLYPTSIDLGGSLFFGVVTMGTCGALWIAVVEPCAMYIDKGEVVWPMHHSIEPIFDTRKKKFWLTNRGSSSLFD
jgi:biotin transporter BioY